MSSDQEHARLFHQKPESKQFLVAAGGSEVTIRIGDFDYASNSDTVTLKYVNIDKSDCHGFVLKADNDFSIKGVNGKTFHTPWSIAANTLFTKGRGLFGDIIITTVAANTLIEIWAE